MKKYYNKYKAWKLDKVNKYSQLYADHIIKSLKKSSSEREFNFWLMKGYDHNLNMIYNYGIFLD